MPTIADNEQRIFDVHNCNKAAWLKPDDVEGESDSELVDIIRAVTNSHDFFYYQNNNNSQNEAKKGIWNYLTSHLPWNKELAIEGDREFNTIMEEGRSLYYEAERVSVQLRQMDEPPSTVFSLKTKTGLLMGAALVFAGSGIGLYLRRSATDNGHNHSSENYHDEKTTVSTHDISPVYDKLESLSLQLKSNDKENHYDNNKNIKFRSLNDFPFLPVNYTYTEDQPEICKTDKFYQDCQKTHRRLLENKSDVFKTLIINISGINCFCPPLKGLPVHFVSPVVSTSTILPVPPSPPTTAEPTTLPPSPPTTAEPTTQPPSLPTTVEPTSLKPISSNVDINKQQINDLTISRCRTRLIGYINSYLNVPSRVDNKELAKLALHLLFLSPYHEARIAQIYLYGTGYFGEMEHEIIDENIRHQLVGDLLSKLIHGKSLEEYLVYSFSINRYISIESYKNNIIKENPPVIPNINSERVNLFYDRYIVPALPFLSTKIISHSEILVGSITWYFIHLASCFAGGEESLYKESSAIKKGLEVLNYFIDGKVSEGSQYRFYMGLKFNFLFSVADATVDTIPEFEYLWNYFRDQLIKRIKFSELFHLTAKSIVKSEENIADKPWDSKYEFTSYILNKYCPVKEYTIYHHENKETKSISNREYSDVKGGDVWCVYLDKNKKAFEGTLPIINTEYKKLLDNVLSYVANSSRLFIESAFRCSDYFNPKMEGDDFFFIDKSALELVLINLNEPRQPVEKLIGPPLKKIHTKMKYYFFRASYHGEQRLYAIDHGSKYLIQRVKIDKQKLKESIGVFFYHWPSYPDNLLTVTIYADKNDAISISEKEPTELFIKKIVDKKFEEANQFIEFQITEDLTLQQEVIEFIKELLIPFYSCIKSLNGWNATDAFLNCLFDGVFLLFPLGKKALSTTRKVSEKFIDISFLIKSNQVFKKEGSFLWKKISNDVYIYNTIINEQCLLKNAIIEMLLSSVDPGLGLLKEIKNTAYSIAMVIMRGGLIKLSLLSIKQVKNLSEFFIRTKSISEGTKKIVVKISKSSGRLSSQHPDDTENSEFNSFSYGIAYQYGDYYAFVSGKGQVDTILGISDETTEDEENIYIILEGEELNGVLFRCICRKTPLSSCEITPWFSPETKREKIIFSETVNSVNGDEFVFKPGALNNFNQFVFYPDYQCVLPQDGTEKSKFFNIFKINGVYYIFDVGNKYLRILYDGDMIDVVDVKNRDEKIPFYYINKNGKGDLIVSRDSSSTSDGKTFLNTSYSPGGYFPFMASDTIHHKMTLHYLSDNLLLNVRERYLELGMLPIKNQFIITDKLGMLPSFIIGWHSLDNTFSTAKPYFKRNSPHIGMNLEDMIKKNCRSGDKLKYYPTLLLSGMMSSRFDTKLRILGSYHPIGQAVNQLFPLECRKSNSSDRYWLYYDLFTESFELVSKQSMSEPPKDRPVSPYEVLIDQIFSVENFPDITEIINIQGTLYNHTLSMRLRQAAFLKRLNPIDRMETLALPLVQVYSWVLHSDVLLIQEKYPAAALWITWQRQVGPLLASKSLTQLPRAIKVNMQNDAKKNYTNGMLINGQYTIHDAIWVNHNEIESPLILRAAEKKYFEEEQVPENNEIDWLPKAKYSSSITVTQFMYEKNIYSEVVINKKYNNIHVANCYSGDGYIERNPAGLEIEHIIINHNGKWLATIDSERNLLVYDLSQMGGMYTKNSIYERVFQITRFLKLDKEVTNNYALLILNDEGKLYYSKENMWVENNGNGALWSPPMNYFPAFISQDQRFLGFKHQSEFTVILYDQKRELMRLLQRPVEQRNTGNIISVAFSALNAVIALAFDDGNVYLYDLICERSDKTLNPIAHIELDKTNDKKIYDNILMRFEDFLYTLTIIHPGYIIGTDVQEKETGYIRSIYSFYHDDSSD